MKEEIKEENYKVVKHNDLVNEKPDEPYTLNQLKLICHLISHIKPTDTNFETKEVQIKDLNFDSIEIVDLLEFKLLLLSRDLITFDDFDFEEKINKFIEPYFDGKSFSSALSQVNNLLEYLVTKKEIGQLKEIQEKVFQIINQHESFKLW